MGSVEAEAGFAFVQVSPCHPDSPSVRGSPALPTRRGSARAPAPIPSPRPSSASRGGWHWMDGRHATAATAEGVPLVRRVRPVASDSIHFHLSALSSLPSPLLSSPLSCQTTTELVSKPHLFSSCPLTGRPTRRPKRPNIFMRCLTAPLLENVQPQGQAKYPSHPC